MYESLLATIKTNQPTQSLIFLGGRHVISLPTLKTFPKEVGLLCVIEL